MKTHEIRLTEDQIDLLLMCLRFCELSHPTVEYKEEFKQVLNRIYEQIVQTELFAKD